MPSGAAGSPAAAAPGPPRARRASGASRTVTSRVSPVGSTQSPASIPAKAGRSDCATCATVTPSEPARPRLSSTIELRLLPAGGQPHVHRARYLLAPRSAACVGQPGQHARVRAPHLDLDLLQRPAEAAGEHRDAGAADPRQLLRAACSPSSSWLSVALVPWGSAGRRSAPGPRPAPAAGSACRPRCRCRRTSGASGRSRATSSALSRVYSRFEPGGVSTMRLISLRSLTGMKPGAAERWPAARWRRRTSPRRCSTIASR